MTPLSRGPCLLLLSIHSASTLTSLLSTPLLSQLRSEPWATHLLAVVHSSPFSLRRSLAFKQILTQLPRCFHLSLPDGDETHLQVHLASSLMHDHVREVAPALFPPLVATNLFPSLVATNLFPQPVATNLFPQPVATNLFPSLVATNLFPQPVATNVRTDSSITVIVDSVPLRHG